MRVNENQLPDKTLHVLRSFLGDERVDEIGAAAVALLDEYATVEELVCLAEHLRLFAEGRAEAEVMKLMQSEP